MNYSQADEIIENGDYTPENISAIRCPDEYSRIRLDESSLSDYVRKLPLKPVGSDVLTHEGRIIHPADEITAVINWKKPSRVQQCADVAIRLHAEFLRSKGKIGSIKYKTLDGTLISYKKWLSGSYSLDSSGSIKYTPSVSKKSDNGIEFENYLQFVMTYANSSSLARDLPVVNEKDLLPGDIYIQPDVSGRGGIGHVSIVLDICENSQIQRLYLFGYGFIPAQDFHLPRPGSRQGIGSWFTLEGYKDHASRFGAGKFHRFQNE